MLIGWATFAATLVTALATAALVRATWVLAKVTTQSYEGSKQANVIAVLKPSRWSSIHINVHVSNTGPAPAFDVAIEITMRDKDDAVIPPAHGYWRRLEIITPRDEFVSYLTSAPPVIGGTIAVDVTWSIAPGAKERFTRKIVVDTQHWDQVAMELGGDPLVQIAQETRKIREDVGRLATGFRRLGVDVFDAADRRFEADRFSKNRGQEPVSEAEREEQ